MSVHVHEKQNNMILIYIRIRMFDIIFERYKENRLLYKCHKAKSFRNKFCFANEKKIKRDSINEKEKETKRRFSTN
jgi:hypothetical protein